MTADRRGGNDSGMIGVLLAAAQFSSAGTRPIGPLNEVTVWDLSHGGPDFRVVTPIALHRE